MFVGEEGYLSLPQSQPYQQSDVNFNLLLTPHIIQFTAGMKSKLELFRVHGAYNLDLNIVEHKGTAHLIALFW